jgi:hypothetical protein
MAREIRKRRASQLRQVTQWRWHLDEGGVRGKFLAVFSSRISTVSKRKTSHLALICQGL